ncbi:unnamed protein product [Coccothraustes coccothraustes]
MVIERRRRLHTKRYKDLEQMRHSMRELNKHMAMLIRINRDTNQLLKLPSAGGKAVPRKRNQIWMQQVSHSDRGSLPDATGPNRKQPH